jgi:hypothetical protein
MLSPPPSVGELRAVGIRPDEYRTIADGELSWRVHRTGSTFAVPWNALRTYGPVLRFDQHPLPEGEHPGVGVWYGASTPMAALGEAFQQYRTIDRGFEVPYLTGLRFTRDVVVLDVATDSAGHWATRSGGTYALSSAEHTATQQWARAICAAFPDLDGIRYNSRFTGMACVALYTPAESAMPGRPSTSRPLADPALAGRLAQASDKLGYRLV